MHVQLATKCMLNNCMVKFMVMVVMYVRVYAYMCMHIYVYLCVCLCISGGSGENPVIPLWQSPRTLGRTYSRVHHD